MLLSDRTDIFVVVRILEAGLQGIVVNVSDRALGLDLIIVPVASCVRVWSIFRPIS